MRHFLAVKKVYRAIAVNSKPTVADILWMSRYENLTQTEKLFGKFDDKVFFANPLSGNEVPSSYLFFNWVRQIGTLTLTAAGVLFFFSSSQCGEVRAAAGARLTELTV